MCLFISVFFPIIFSNLLLCTLFFFIKKKSTNINFTIILPILFFIWLALSFFWSIQPEKTIHSIPRELFLLLIPFIYFTNENIALKKVKDFFLKTYSYSALIFSCLFLIRAIFRFIITKNYSVFLFHGEYQNDYGLVPKELNAVHVSVFVAIAYFYFLTKKNKSKLNKFSILILLLFIILLSSTNITIITFLLTIVFYLFFSKISNRMRLRNSIILFSILISFTFFNKISLFVELELKNNTNKGIGHNVINESSNLSNRVTIYEAWTKEQFSPKDFFPGMAFRVYQARMFCELVKQNPIFWKGFGFNASQNKLEEKGVQFNVFLGNENSEGYQKKNFHNQYIQVFAELGFIGFLILLLLLFMNAKNAFKSKDFTHIAFAILMISLFLTESFLWRQRGVVFFTLFYCLFNSKSVK